MSRSASTAAPPPSSVTDAQLFELRWRRAARDLMTPLARLYGAVADMGDFEDRLRHLLREKWEERPGDLRALDMARDIDPRWFLDARMAGYVFYVDRFAGDMAGVAEAIPYLADLGITYAHLMPCLQPRPGNSDGGYAVMDYGAIDPRLGTMDDFRALTAAMRAAGISPCIDMVLNHTAREHPWAEAARAGDPFYRAFYRVFPQPEIPLAFEATLPEVFPDQAPGNFCWEPEMAAWVWTTFNTFQWDLNWENPEVFLAILGIVLDLANAGAEVLRLDAVAFMWKRMGTTCQNQPEVHDILQAINQATSVAAPAVIHKAEAIVGPDQLVPYLGAGRHVGKVCNLAYHNSLMVQFWSSLAAQDTAMMTGVLARRFPESFVDAEWATYIRCHDDIGWAVTEDDAERYGITGPGHRRFLAEFYAGRFPGSFARGEDFQIDEATGDRRTNGSFASLAGLEAALETGDRLAVDMAVERIVTGHALIASFGGMPLLYMGDEIGLTNDPSYLDDPDLAGDGRWLHRPRMDWDAARSAPASDGPHGRIFRAVRHLLGLRRELPELGGATPTHILQAGHDRLLCYRRAGTDATLTAILNLTPQPQEIEPGRIGLDGPIPDDLISAGPVPLRDGRLMLAPYGRLWLRAPVW